MSQFSVNVENLRQLSRENLIHLLKVIPGQKDLIIDKSLMKPLDLIAEIKLLRDHGVQSIFKLERIAPEQHAQQLVYIIPSSLIFAKYVADQINAEFSHGKTYVYHLILVPRNLVAIQQLMEEEGIFGHITMHEFSWDLIPLDPDLLSLEIPDFFKSYFLNGDQAFLPCIARSIWCIQSLFGQIPNIYGQGSCASIVQNMMSLLFEQYGKPNVINPQIGHLFIFDRDIDYATPLLSQLTYEGLLDEVFGIKAGIIEFGKKVTGKEQPVKLQLSSKDKIFSEIRNRHFSGIFEFLLRQAKQIQSQHSKAQSMSIQEMKKFVQNDIHNVRSQHKSLALHIGASEVIKETKGAYFEEQLQVEYSVVQGVNYKESVTYIKDCMAKLYPKEMCLRLLCLYSYTQDGLSAKEFKSLKSEFLQSYGFQHMVTLHNLEKLGLLNIQGSYALTELTSVSVPVAQVTENLANRVAQVILLPRHGSFRMVTRNLGLITKADNDCDLQNPRDIGYVFNGAYIPLACKLVQEILKRGGIKGLEDTMKLLPGSLVSDLKPQSLRSKAPPVALVYFIGGVTYAEVAAFRLLGTIIGYRFIIAGTSMINGDVLVNSAI